MELKAGVEEYLGTDFGKRQGKYFCLSQPLMKGDFSNTLLLLNKEKNNLFVNRSQDVLWLSDGSARKKGMGSSFT